VKKRACSKTVGHGLAFLTTNQLLDIQLEFEPQTGGASDQKRRRLSNLSDKTPSRKMKVIKMSDDDEDSTTVEWETSSSEEDVQVLDQRIRNRKVARKYQDKDNENYTRIFENSSTKRFKQDGISTPRNTPKDITKVGGSSVYARFKQGGVSTSRNTCKYITKVSGSSVYVRFKQGRASTSRNTGKEITKAGVEQKGCHD